MGCVGVVRRMREVELSVGVRETYPFVQVSLVVLVKSHPFVQAFTSSTVRPFALPYVYPLTVGKYSPHWRVKYSALTERETRLGMLEGAPLFAVSVSV